ncbi:MAG UNVERIFIED_CONTAM: VCBS repeat-containing protein [Planctomycetaceae bacterium]|jgi:hypothetical protein
MIVLCGCGTGKDGSSEIAGNTSHSNSDEQPSIPFVRRFEKVALPAPTLKSMKPLTETSRTSAEDRWHFPRIMAGGCGIADFNRDGRPDLVTVGLSPAAVPELAVPYIQLLQQVDSGDFVDVTETSGLQFEGIPCGVASGDFTNDGLPDLCLTGAGDCRLFENLGGFRFRDLNDTAGVSRDRWSTSASFLDYDRDGWLDLFVTNYVDYDSSHACRDAAGSLDFCSPAVFPAPRIGSTEICGGKAPNQIPQGIISAMFQWKQGSPASRRCGSGSGLCGLEQRWLDGHLRGQ